MKIVCGRSQSTLLASRIVKELEVKLCDIRIQDFSDGEIWVKYDESIRDENVYIIQSTHAPSENLIELLMLIDAAKRASAKRVIAVIPYFGYARQDRKDQPRVAIGSKLMANLISKAGADAIISMDLHAPQIQGFFDIPFDHLVSSATFIPFLKSELLLNQNVDDFIVATPDVGGSKRARTFAKQLGCDIVIIDKRRGEHDQSEVMNVIGNCENKKVLLIDDIIDTAGTFTNAAKALYNQGAKEIYGICTHPVLSGNANSKLEYSKLWYVLATDTLGEKDGALNKIRTVSVAKLFAEAIRRSEEGKSISSMFYE